MVPLDFSAISLGLGSSGLRAIQKEREPDGWTRAKRQVARLGVFIRGRSRVPSAQASREFAVGAKQRVSGIERFHSFRQPDPPMNRRYLKDTAQPRTGRVQRLTHSPVQPRNSRRRYEPLLRACSPEYRAAVVWHRSKEKSPFDGPRMHVYAPL